MLLALEEGDLSVEKILVRLGRPHGQIDHCVVCISGSVLAFWFVGLGDLGDLGGHLSMGDSCG